MSSDSEVSESKLGQENNNFMASNDDVHAAKLGRKGNKIFLLLLPR